MAIYDLVLSRNNGPTANNYVGHKGRLFYDSTDGLLRLSDGTTAGGKIVSNLALAATGITAPINPYPGELWYNPTTKELWAYYNGQFRGTINPATPTTLGGIKAGPGVVVASDGTLSLDSTGIPFNFGDFYAFTNPGPDDGACLSSINLNQNVNLVSNGTGAINIVGELNVHKTAETLEDALTALPVFNIDAAGQVKILVPVADINSGSVRIVGNATGTSVAPRLAGVMLHVTGNNNQISRIYNDGSGNNAEYVGRRYNGTAESPTQILANESILRITAVGHDNTEMPLDGTASIFFDALQNFTTTARGSQLKFQTTPLNGTTREFVATIDSQNGITAIKGFLRYDITNGNATATQLTSKSTAVTCNGRTGQITMSNSSIAKGEAITFTVNNSLVTEVTDIPVVTIQSGGTTNSYSISVTRVQVGSFNITIVNNGTGPLTDTLILNFAIIKVS